MSIVEDDLFSIAESIWHSTFGLQISHCDGNIAPETQTSDQVTGLIHIHGELGITVLLQCSGTLATHVARRMFSIEEEQVQPADRSDAIRELTNMLGGSFKSLLPGDGDLSIPDLAAEEIAGTQLANQVAFTCDNGAFSVSLRVSDNLPSNILETTRQNEQEKYS